MLNTKSYSQYGIDDMYSDYKADSGLLHSAYVSELKRSSNMLKEGFSTGSIAFFMTVILTILAGITTDKTAQFVASKFMPDISSLIQNPLLQKVAERGMKAFMKVASKINIVSSIAYMAMVTIMSLLTVWIANTITLTAVIYNECGKFDIWTAMRNAWAGAVPTCVFASIHVVVLFVLQKIPFTMIFVSILDAVMGTFLLVMVMLGTNLIFGAGIGQASAKSQACKK